MFYDPQCKSVTVEPWRKMLLDAADVMERRGHVKKALISNDGVCLQGALRLAGGQGDRESYTRATGALSRYLGFVSEHENTVWNDLPERTKDESIAALRGAALKAVAGS